MLSPVEEHYLQELEKCEGGLYLAAQHCGINYKTTLRWRESRPEFEEAVREVLERQWDGDEANLRLIARKTNNPLPYFFLLKGGRPLRYIERHAILAATQDAPSSPEEWRALLATVTGTLSPSARARLALPSGADTLSPSAPFGAALPSGLEPQALESISSPEPERESDGAALPAS